MNGGYNPCAFSEAEKVGKLAEENLMRKLLAFAPAVLILIVLTVLMIVANAQKTQALCPEAAPFRAAEKPIVC